MSELRTEQPEIGREQLTELLVANPGLRRAALSGIPAAIKRELTLLSLGGRIDPRTVAVLGALVLGVVTGMPGDPHICPSHGPVSG